MKVNTLGQFSGLSRYELWASSWAESDNIDIFSYMSAICKPEDCLLFCRLLFPDFFISQGAIFLNAKYDHEVFLVWLKKLDGDISAVEKIMNHTHMYDVFSGCTDEVDDVVFEQLADTIAFSWRLVLKDKFPGCNFSVEVSNSDQDYGPTVTFYQSIGYGEKRDR
ncbi:MULTISPECIES: hypothetical protein [unclassified Pseudomonas]|uniref:hypothetical protein n=1 Tax=unclassified Pseudomonas TaxID=196821 RepID=UPI0021147C45|nr:MULTISPECIES: hypothetical protein [unclassified Pseudomonas]